MTVNSAMVQDEMMQQREAPPISVASGNRWAGLAVASMGIFLAVLSGSLVSVALPTIGRTLHSSATGLEWTIDAYILVYASLMIAGGVIGDRWGRRNAFALGFVIFGIGSLAAGLAPTSGLLIAARAMQGIGPALLTPASVNIVRWLFDDPRERATALGLWSLASGLAMASGPLIGGLIVDSVGWRGIFLLNIPIIIICLIAVKIFMPQPPRVLAEHRFDVVGAILSVIAVGAVTFAIIEGQSLGWGSPVVIGSALLGVLVMLGFLWWERRVPGPLIQLNLFRSPPFAAATLSGMALFFSFIGAIVYFSAYFQQVQGLSALRAGINVSALGIAFAITAPLSGYLVGRIGPRWPLVGGMALTTVAMFMLLRLEVDTPISAIWWNFALVGAGFGISLTPMTTTALASVPAERAGMAGAILNALRQFGQVLGVAVLGAITYSHLGNVNVAGPRLNRADQFLFMRGLNSALFVSAMTLAVMTLVAWILFWRYAHRPHESLPGID